MKAFALAVLLLVSFTGALAQQKIAIIDAGSSGSRLYVYEIGQDGKSVDTLCSQKLNKPLSKVTVHQDSVLKYLEEMTGLYKAKEKDSIDLYVLATAGMRYEPKEKADSIYRFMKDKASSIRQFRLKGATTISGRYEGLYAWIALNYDYKIPGVVTSVTEKPLIETADSTYGIIEIGGASMQITFAAPQGMTPPEKDCISRNGFSRIYSKSYLGGGVDKIYEAFRDGHAGTDYSTGCEGVKNLPKLSGMNMTFYGLGTPIQLVVEGMKTHKTREAYMGTLKATDKYHPVSNAHYILWLAGQLEKDILDIKKPDTEVSWTKGAALDIVINGERPEAFSYDHPN